MAVYQGSRYIKTPLYPRGDTQVFGIRQRNHFDLTKATYYTVVQGDTLDGIAYRQYGNSQLWWAIMDANPQYQSELEITVAGNSILIPAFEEVVRVSE